MTAETALRDLMSCRSGSLSRLLSEQDRARILRLCDAAPAAEGGDPVAGGRWSSSAKSAASGGQVNRLPSFSLPQDYCKGVSAGNMSIRSVGARSLRGEGSQTLKVLSRAASAGRNATAPVASAPSVTVRSLRKKLVSVMAKRTPGEGSIIGSGGRMAKSFSVGQSWAELLPMRPGSGWGGSRSLRGYSPKSTIKPRDIINRIAITPPLGRREFSMGSSPGGFILPVGSERSAILEFVEEELSICLDMASSVKVNIRGENPPSHDSTAVTLCHTVVTSPFPCLCISTTTVAHYFLRLLKRQWRR